jgi:hypothetical protein
LQDLWAVVSLFAKKPIAEQSKYVDFTQPSSSPSFFGHSASIFTGIPAKIIPVWHKSRHKALKATCDGGLSLSKYWLPTLTFFATFS